MIAFNWGAALIPALIVVTYVSVAWLVTMFTEVTGWLDERWGPDVGYLFRWGFWLICLGVAMGFWLS